MIKLLIGGSPCTKWSIAQKKDRETTAEGEGWELFLNYKIAKEKFKPDFFLYENNKSMSTAIRAQITRELGVEPVLINSALVSAQNRQRLYWVGKRMPDGTYSQVPVEQPEDRGILLRDILETGVAWQEKSYCITATEYKGSNAEQTLTKRRRTMAAEPIRIGTIENDAKRQDFDSQQYRVYSPDGKSVTLCGNGGGVGAKTELYAVPVPEPVNTTADGKAQCLLVTYYKDGIRNMAGNMVDRKTCVDVCVNPLSSGKSRTVDAHMGKLENNLVPRMNDPNPAKQQYGCIAAPMRVYEATAQGYTDIQPGECVGLTMPKSKTRRGRAMREKSNCLTTSCEYYEYCGTLDAPVYKVEDGYIAINEKKYPIKLRDGCYIIRKLTVTECKRLQTVPDSYVFPVSNSQSYKMLGNGWTVDVIAHIMSHFAGLTEEPVEVLSMYDGMSCGHIALDKLGGHIERYYATEIDKYAIQTTQRNYPDIIQLGDAFDLRRDDWHLPEMEADENE